MLRTAFREGRIASSARASLLAASLLVAAAATAVEDQETLEAASPGPAEARPDAKPDLKATERTLCELVETAAAENGIPVDYFTRLIWKESRFREDAVSPKGAQGIAQFMPGTAAERGLTDPFDATAAIPASAKLLADLSRRFGNLGLAAAAYNAGANRVSSWLNGGTLPWETRDYVLSITGMDAETWADESANLPDLAGDETCLALTALLGAPGSATATMIETTTAPWGVQLAGGFSRARVIAAYEALQRRHPSLLADRTPMIVGGRMAGRGSRAFYRIRVPVDTRNDGEAFCLELRRDGGVCIVLKS